MVWELYLNETIILKIMSDDLTSRGKLPKP